MSAYLKNISLSVGNLPHSGVQVGKRDGREQSESAPGGEWKCTIADYTLIYLFPEK